MAIADIIRRKIEQALKPQYLEVVDDSHRHEGHGGWRPGGETHFRLTIVAEAFAGLSRVERHRLVSAVLAEELAGPVHALGLTTRAPGERFPPDRSGPGTP